MVTAAEEAVTQATAEGLTLEQSKHATSGYKGVYEVPGMSAASKKYEAKVTLSGTRGCLGKFATAEEAALAIARAKARTLAPDTAAGEVSTAEAVVTQATAEGLKLEQSENGSSAGAFTERAVPTQRRSYTEFCKQQRPLLPEFLRRAGNGACGKHLGKLWQAEKATYQPPLMNNDKQGLPTQSRPPFMQTEKRPVKLQLGIWQGRVCATACTRRACPAPGCSFVFESQSQLDRHLLCHTGERPLPTVAAVPLLSIARVTPILRKLKLQLGGRPRPRHPVVSLKLSVCSDSGLVCALAEVTSRKATVRDADPSWSEDEERERKRTKKEKAPPISHMCLICV